MPRKERQLSGPEKAVVILLSVDDKTSTDIISRLDPGELTTVSSYANLLEEVTRDKVLEIKREFGQRLAERTGGLSASSRSRLRRLMEECLKPEDLEEVLEVLEKGESTVGLETLKWLDPPTIAAFIKNEHPQTIALILAHLDAPAAASVLSLVSESLQSDIILRIANLERINPDVVRDLNEILAKELTASGAAHNQRVGGVEAVSEIVNALDKSTENRVMTKIEEINPALADSIRELMFVFEDLLNLDDRGMQNIMKEVSNDVLTLALKTASPELRDKMFRSISTRAAEMIREELEIMGPVKISDVENAQNEIVKIARRLEEEGKIAIGGAGGEELV